MMRAISSEVFISVQKPFHKDQCGSALRSLVVAHQAPPGTQSSCWRRGSSDRTGFAARLGGPRPPVGWARDFTSLGGGRSTQRGRAAPWGLAARCSRCSRSRHGNCWLCRSRGCSAGVPAGGFKTSIELGQPQPAGLPEEIDTAGGLGFRCEHQAAAPSTPAGGRPELGQRYWGLRVSSKLRLSASPMVKPTGRSPPKEVPRMWR